MVKEDVAAAASGLLGALAKRASSKKAKATPRPTSKKEPATPRPTPKAAKVKAKTSPAKAACPGGRKGDAKAHVTSTLVHVATRKCLEARVGTGKGSTRTFSYHVHGGKSAAETAAKKWVQEKRAELCKK